MKIIDKTSKQNLSYMDCKFWENHIIKDLVYWLIIDYSKDKIVITDDVVENYNKLTNQRKSNASFVRQVKKLNKQKYFVYLDASKFTVGEIDARKYLRDELKDSDIK